MALTYYLASQGSPRLCRGGGNSLTYENIDNCQSWPTYCDFPSRPLFQFSGADPKATAFASDPRLCQSSRGCFASRQDGSANRPYRECNTLGKEVGRRTCAAGPWRLGSACTLEKSVLQFEQIEFDYDDERAHEHGKE